MTIQEEMPDSLRALEELERQVERGSLFTQAVLQRLSQRISATEVLLGEMLEAARPDGADEPEDEVEGVATAEDETEEPRRGKLTWPTIAIREEDPPDPDDTEPVRLVDCDARMNICHAVCCRLRFPLSAREIDEGHVKWDIGHPYMIRHEGTGHCVHNDQTTGRCGVYEHRPAVCRNYSCEHDARIWTDFDNMVLNQEWIDEHLGPDRIFLAAPTMVSVELTRKPERASS